MMSLEKLTSPDYHIFFEKVRLFYDITWKFELALISRWEVSTKTRQFLYIHLKIQGAPVIMIWNFRKNILDLTKSLENLIYPIITSWHFRENETVLLNWFDELLLLSRADIFAQKDSFDGVTWNFEVALLSRADICKTKAFFDDVT